MAKTKQYQLQLTTKQLLFTLTALFFCFLLTFALGAITGIRFFADSNDPLITSSTKEEADPSPGAYGALESHTVTDPEGEKVVHEFTFYNTLPEKAATPMPQVPPQPEAKQEKVAPSTKKTTKKPSSSESPAQQYTIQFGSFKEEKKAHALSNKLNKQGLLAHVSTIHIKNRGTFYRVRMGSFDTQEAAKEWASKLPPLSPPPFITSATN
jgi:cell division septation protein DedD